MLCFLADVMATVKHNNMEYLRDAVVVIEMPNGRVYNYPATIGVDDDDGRLKVVAGGPQGNPPARGITVRVGLVSRTNMVMRNGIITH